MYITFKCYINQILIQENLYGVKMSKFIKYNCYLIWIDRIIEYIYHIIDIKIYIF
jgi:hypothetical protein